MMGNRKLRRVTALVGFVAGLSGAGEVCRAQVAGGYGDYLDWEGWARVQPDVETWLASSYDRGGGNYDYNHYEDPTGWILESRDVVAATLQGPGIIYRYWMPHREAKRRFAIRMYFDGEATPRIDTDSLEILNGTFGYFSSPLVDTCAGGQVCYEPIPFETSVRIETENIELRRNYYQYTWRKFPPGTDVTSYTGSLAPAVQTARTDAASLFNTAGQHPAGSSGSAVRVETPLASIPGNTCLTLADLTGPGMIRQLSVRMDGATDAELSGLSLRVSYDDEPQAAIDIPVASFFGAGYQRAAYQSIPIGTDSADGFYCYWPMPFRDSVTVELCNTTASAIEVDAAVVEYESLPLTKDMAYLRAALQSSARQAGQIYHPIMSATGCGHFVGCLLYVEQADVSFRILEGDEVITVDGTQVLNGTGLEDAFNAGYYYNWVVPQSDEPEGVMPQSATRPLHGILYVHQDEVTPIARADQYRWQIADRVGFSESIDVKIENQYAEVGAAFTSVAFWYQLPLVLGDYDGDCDVDGDDFDAFEDCASAPGVDHAGGCGSKDHDGDGDVDGDDFARFQRCFSGEDELPDPDCE